MKPTWLTDWLKPAHILTPRQIVRKSKQESARKGQSTETRNRMAKALRLKEEGLL